MPFHLAHLVGVDGETEPYQDFKTLVLNFLKGLFKHDQRGYSHPLWFLDEIGWLFVFLSAGKIVHALLVVQFSSCYLRSLCQGISDVWRSTPKKEENNHKEEHSQPSVQWSNSFWHSSWKRGSSQPLHCCHGLWPVVMLNFPLSKEMNKHLLWMCIMLQIY